jgi:hypothetical protein
MSAERVTFQIGASVAACLYTIIDGLDSWRLNAGVPMCGKCGQVIHIDWDSPPRTGLAFCRCNLSDKADWRKVVQERI